MEGLLRTTRPILTLLFLSIVSAFGRSDDGQPAGETIPEPRFDRIDYARPLDYLTLNESLVTPSGSARWPPR